MPKRITEDQILEATIEVLLERGYASATTRHIAQRADMSEVTLFRRFGNKAKLTIAAVTHAVEKESYSPEYTGDVEHDLLQVLTFFQRQKHSRQTSLMPLILTEVPRFPELQEALEAPFARISGVGQLLVRYQQEGVLKEEHPLHAVAALTGPLIILKLLGDANPHRDIPDLELKSFIQAFLSGHRKSN